MCWVAKDRNIHYLQCLPDLIRLIAQQAFVEQNTKKEEEEVEEEEMEEEGSYSMVTEGG